MNTISKPKEKLLIFTVLVMASLTGAGIAIYVPSLPAIAADFSVAPKYAKATIGLYIIGVAIGQLLWGGFADSVSRRRLLLYSLAGYMISTVAVIYSASITSFLFFRFCQGFTISGCSVINKSIFANMFSGKKLFKEVSNLAIARSLGPTFAPFVGGALQEYSGDWHASFYFLLGYAFIAFILVIFCIPNADTLKKTPTFVSTFQTYLSILKHRYFIFLALCLAATYSCTIVFHTLSPFFIQDQLNVSAVWNGGLALLLGGSVLLGNVLNRLLLMRYRVVNIMTGAAVNMVLASIVMFAFSFIFPASLLILMLPSLWVIANAALVYSNGLAKALQLFPEKAGSASALMGFSMMSMTTLISLAVSSFHTNILLVLSLAFCMMACFCLWVAWFVIRPETKRRRGELAR